MNNSHNSHSKWLLVVDSFTVLLLWYLAYNIRFNFLPNAQHGIEGTFIKISPILLTATLYSFYKNSLYHLQRFQSRFLEALSLIKANIIAVTILILLLYFFGEERISRLTIFIYLALSIIGFTITRAFARNVIKKSQRSHPHKVLLVGNGDPILSYIKTVYKMRNHGIHFLGWIDSQNQAEKNHEIPIINQSYEEYRKQQPIDSIILSYTGKDSFKSSLFIENHHNDVVPIHLLPDLSYSMVGHQIEDFGGVPLLSINQPNLNVVEIFFKRFFECLATLVGLLIISPLLILISLLVKLTSPGPIFFGQERVGLNGRNFKMWKFRSMKVAANNEDKTEWSNKDNPRKTKLGDFLRKTSLDELPQLWNVIVGDMSLVGPRPEQPFFVDKFRHEIPGYMLKHKMKPGITGWAQVNGWRGDTSIKIRIEHDIYYIKNWSLWLDIKIIFLTFWKGFINKNAY